MTPQLYRILVVLIAAGALLSGCATARPASEPLGSGPPLPRADVNGRAHRSEARLTLATGESVAARALHVAPDLTTWLDPASGRLRSAPSADVLAVRFVSRHRRTVRGAVIGCLVGAVVGLGAGALIESVEGGDAAVVGLVGGTVVGAGLGALLGRASSAPRPMPR